MARKKRNANAFLEKQLDGMHKHDAQPKFPRLGVRKAHMAQLDEHRIGTIKFYKNEISKAQLALNTLKDECKKLQLELAKSVVGEYADAIKENFYRTHKVEFVQAREHELRAKRNLHSATIAKPILIPPISKSVCLLHDNWGEHHAENVEIASNLFKSPDKTPFTYACACMYNPEFCCSVYYDPKLGVVQRFASD